MNINREALEKEFSFRTSRSGGKGGQNVNKVSTKVELLWNFNASTLFTEDEKSKIALRLANRISNDEIFHVVAEEERTQLRNKEIAIKKTIKLIGESLKEEKKRKPSKPTYSSVKKRLDDKRIKSLKKINRGGGLDSF
ncbi:alternative ribosome rescue aminoacyl-tRNA hydrolase ArfB [Pedobacter cryophilus]|uniref:Aminoacyl-tRNA hydrolase n=1 Tax=Pedobacter cryophilus TaxID=2571271 RepID=A0A4U1BZ70_9SPHI|nr:alternative ribosome rescue aminoacyl-tRNA hydrolase ArfB [Pedobacter cryophilus]TKB96796.1 aminoacyl-tRNA hydrolase [Pedobacter cryophilus]